MSAIPKEDTGERVHIAGDVAYAPAWGWDSTQDTILGFQVRADVHPPIPVIDGSNQSPAINLTFPNGWVLSLTFFVYDTPKPGEYVASMVVASAYPGDGFVSTTFGSSPLGIYPNLDGIKDAVYRVAQQPATPLTPAADALIARYVEPHPWDRGIAGYQIKESGVSVWTVIDYLEANHGDIDAVAEMFAIPREAVDAARAFYQRNRAVIDDRIAQNRF